LRGAAPIMPMHSHANVDLYGSSEWVNIRTAVKNFLVHVVKFDVEAWEKRELPNA
jgi:hypothetical protein